MPRMIEQKLVQKLNKDNIPNISQMDNQYLNLDMDQTITTQFLICLEQWNYI